MAAIKIIFLSLAITGSIALAISQHDRVGLPGGLTGEKPMTDEVRRIVSEVEDQIKAKESSIRKIEPISYKTQVVAGTNYFVKARVYDSDNSPSYVHLRIYKSFRNNLEFHGLKKTLNENVALEHF